MNHQRFKPQQLEERLIDFAVNVCKVVEKLPTTLLGHHIAKQLCRSATAPAPNYGEAQGASCKKDFIHKIRISLKELRESLIWIKLIGRLEMVKPEIIQPVHNEAGELVAIFVQSAKTAEQNLKSK